MKLLNEGRGHDVWPTSHFNKRGAITDVIDHMKNGLIIEKQPYELSKAVEYLIHNPEKRYKMGVNAQNKFKKEFTLKVFEKRLLTILQKL